MESNSKTRCVDYDGKGDVKVFITKFELVAAVKGYEGEKKAQCVACKLAGPALDVYMRLPDEDKKNCDRIKEELLKEFERGQLNREEAIHLLDSRRRQPEESPQTFAYKLLELVKLAYPSFTEEVRKTLVKDCFMRGVHPDMQIALKSSATFTASDVNTLATETVRLELDGIKSYGKKRISSEVKSECSSSDVSVVNESIINSIAEKVLEKLQVNIPNAGGNPDSDASDNQTSNQVNYTSNAPPPVKMGFGVVVTVVEQVDINQEASVGNEDLPGHKKVNLESVVHVKVLNI